MRNMKAKYAKKIIEVLQDAKEPQDAQNVRVKAGIANWQTAMKHLLELVLEGVIQGQKTSRGWIFWIKKEAPKE